MAAVEDVVLALRAAREPADSAKLAERPEPLVAPGHELVGVCLVPRVPDDRLARRLEQPMEGEGDLHDPQGRAQVATGPGDGGDDRLADLRGKHEEVALGEGPDVPGALDARKNDQRWTLIGRRGSGTGVARLAPAVGAALASPARAMSDAGALPTGT